MTTEIGYRTPVVTVASSLANRGLGDAVLIVAVVSTDDRAVVAGAEPYLERDAIAAIEDGLHTLGATGGVEQVNRLVVAALPVASVLAVGLGPATDDWPADKIRRAAGVATRSLDKAQAVVTTLSALDLAATVEGLILGAYRFTEFRSPKTAPKEPGLQRITLLAPDTKKATKSAADRAATVAGAVATARDFVNTPPSH